jgi:hypothetical protein
MKQYLSVVVIVIFSNSVKASKLDSLKRVMESYAVNLLEYADLPCDYGYSFYSYFWDITYATKSSI